MTSTDLKQLLLIDLFHQQPYPAGDGYSACLFDDVVNNVCVFFCFYYATPALTVSFLLLLLLLLFPLECVYVCCQTCTTAAAAAAAEAAAETAASSQKQDRDQTGLCGAETSCLSVHIISRGNASAARLCHKNEATNWRRRVSVVHGQAISLHYRRD